MGSLLQETVFDKLLQSGPSHRLLSFRNRLFERGYPTRSQVLPVNLLQPGLLSPCSHRSCQEPAPAQGLHTARASLGCIHLLQHAVLHGLQVDICSTMDLHGLQWNSLPHLGLLHGLQGNLFSGAWNTFPSFFTDLCVCKVVSFTCSHHSLLPAVALFPLLKYVIIEVLPPSLMGSALASGTSFMELPHIDSTRHRGWF